MAAMASSDDIDLLNGTNLSCSRKSMARYKELINVACTSFDTKLTNEDTDAILKYIFLTQYYVHLASGISLCDPSGGYK